MQSTFFSMYIFNYILLTYILGLTKYIKKTNQYSWHIQTSLLTHKSNANYQYIFPNSYSSCRIYLLLSKMLNPAFHLYFTCLHTTEHGWRETETILTGLTLHLWPWTSEVPLMLLGNHTVFPFSIHCPHSLK